MPAHISREANESDSEEFRISTEEARAVRASVADQLAQMINEMDMTGSRGYLVRRLKELNAAVASEDPMALNAAVMEVAAAAGSWAAGIQLTEPMYISLRNAQKRKLQSAAA
jgi:hypothetical protein